MIDPIPLMVYGRVGVGRSALAVRLLRKHFIEYYDPTIVEDNYCNKLTVDGKEFVLDILDVSSEDDYVIQKVSNMKQARGFLLVYDITDRSSFDVIDSCCDEILKARQKETNRSELQIVICGNKCDLFDKRQVETSEGEEFARSRGYDFFETSTKTGENVEEAFAALVRRVIKQPVEQGPENKGRCFIC